VAKSDVVGRVVAVLRGTTERRGLTLTEHRSRAVPAGQIHELMLTDELSDLGSTIQRVALLAFFEVVQGGIILAGDQVTIGDTLHGTLAGFNETHMPNHLNLCLYSADLSDGETRGLRIGDVVRIWKADG
jgi:hypothetical protein